MNWEQRISEDPKLVTVVIIIISFVVIAVIGFCCACCCKARYGSSERNPGDDCTHCQLINMGEAACYTGYCSECGRVPSSIGTKVVIKEN
jgi:hypothetical protein